MIFDQWIRSVTAIRANTFLPEAIERLQRKPSGFGRHGGTSPATTERGGRKDHGYFGSVRTFRRFLHVVELSDGRTIGVPFAWFPRLSRCLL